MDKLDTLISRAVGTDESVRRQALKALHDRGPGEAGAIAAAWRQQPPGRAHRLVPLMVRWPATLVVEIFAPLLNDNAPGVAVSAAAILGGVRDAAAIPSLADALHLPVVDAAAAALGASGCVAGIPPLQQLFQRLVSDSHDIATVDEEDPSNAQLVAVVVRSLGQLGDTSHARWLIDILASAQEVTAREAAAEALRDVPVAEALAALTEGLTGSTHTLQANALHALWSYRTIAAIDAIVHTPLAEHLRADGAAMLYDVAAVEVTEDDAWAAIWSQRRVRLPPNTCLLAGEPITAQALVDRVRSTTRVEQALGELTLFYGFRPRWDRMLDEPAVLLDAIDRWVREVGVGFAAGRLYRFGREVSIEHLPQPRI